MRKTTIFIPLLLLAVLVSCGRQSKAEDLVEAFVQENALAPEKMAAHEFSRLDSTKRLNDSIVLDMQRRGNEYFKQDIDYPVKTSGRMLYYLRMTYYPDSDTLWNTFYLDEQLEQVVSFK